MFQLFREKGTIPAGKGFILLFLSLPNPKYEVCYFPRKGVQMMRNEHNVSPDSRECGGGGGGGGGLYRVPPPKKKKKKKKKKRNARFSLL